MPKRSSRSKLSNNSNSSSNNSLENNDSNNNSSSNKSIKESSRRQELPAVQSPSGQALESYYGPNELKRHIADALRETTIKIRVKKDQKSSKKGGGASLEARANAKNSGGGDGGGGGPPEQLELPPKKMIYADAVRNLLAKTGGDKERVVTIPKSDLGNNEWVPEKQDMEKSLISSGEEALSRKDEQGKPSGCLREGEPCKQGPSGSSVDTASPSTLSNLLANMDPDILQELDDTTWEVISIDDWSQCGSDVDEQFHLIGRDEPTAAVAPTNSGSVSAAGDLPSKTNCAASMTKPAQFPSSAADLTSKAGAPVMSSAAGGGSGSAAAAAAKKKKVVVTRKYIGGVDLAEKLLSLGFQAVVGGDEAADDGGQHWAGAYRTAVVAVSARRRCGLLVVSVRAESEALLLGLTALQGLIEDTGLLSYANCSLPSLLLQQRGAAVST